MTHDPLCEWWQAQCEGYDCAPDPGELCEHFYCLCDLIAKVRADEKAKIFPNPADARGEQHVDYCRDLYCGGCYEIGYGT